MNSNTTNRYAIVLTNGRNFSNGNVTETIIECLPEKLEQMVQNRLNGAVSASVYLLDYADNYYTDDDLVGRYSLIGDIEEEDEEHGCTRYYFQYSGYRFADCTIEHY